MFRSEGNKLIFADKVTEDVLPVTAALYNLIEKQKYEDIVLDFEKVTYIGPRFMIPLVTTARYYRGKKADFEIVFPEIPAAYNIMLNANWAHLVSPERYSARDNRNRNHLSAIQFRDADDQFRAVDRCMEVLLQCLVGLDRSKLKALEWSLNEISDNVLNHSESPLGGIIQVTTYPKKGRVEFYVCDAGIGIPRSLRQAHPDIHDDTSALRKAIEEGVTRNKNTNAGNGLFGTYKCCEVSGGAFDVLSGYVKLSFSPGSLSVVRNNIPYRGTFVCASINYTINKLLEKALVFKGKAWDPPSDYIERKFEGDGEDIRFIVGKELEALGTRESGRRAFNKISTLMNNKTSAIVFDFSDIHLISSSFADEVFGKLFYELGAIAFGRLCKFKRVDPTVQKLIDRAIAQRIRM